MLTIFTRAMNEVVIGKFDVQAMLSMKLEMCFT